MLLVLDRSEFASPSHTALLPLCGSCYAVGKQVGNEKKTSLHSYTLNKVCIYTAQIFFQRTVRNHRSQWRKKSLYGPHLLASHCRACALNDDVLRNLLPDLDHHRAPGQSEVQPSGVRWTKTQCPRGVVFVSGRGSIGASQWCQFLHSPGTDNTRPGAIVDQKESWTQCTSVGSDNGSLPIPNSSQGAVA